MPFGGGFPDAVEIIARAVTFIVAITVHEFMHAWSANALGDPTARQQGRITLNPLAHFDPVGFLFALLLVFGLFGIAWGKPVPVNPHRLRGGRRGFALVAAAGPLSNLALAAIAAVPLWVAVATGQPPALLENDIAAAIIKAMILWNIGLFAFNLVPIPPLDGFNILAGILPSYWVPKLEVVRQYGLLILLVVMFLPVPGGGPLLGYILGPVMRTLVFLLVPAQWLRWL